MLGTTADFAKKYPNTCRAVTAAIIEAGKWIDASLANKNKMAETIADKSYVNTSVDVINQRILGRYQNGMGKTWDDPNHMKFYNDGVVGYPYLSDGMWFLTQHKRWGLLKDPSRLFGRSQGGEPHRHLQTSRPGSQGQCAQERYALAANSSTALRGTAATRPSMPTVSNQSLIHPHDHHQEATMVAAVFHTPFPSPPVRPKHC